MEEQIAKDGQGYTKSSVANLTSHVATDLELCGGGSGCNNTHSMWNYVVGTGKQKVIMHCIQEVLRGEEDKVKANHSPYVIYDHTTLYAFVYTKH